MPYKDPIKAKENKKKRYLANRSAILERQREYRQANAPTIRERIKEYRATNRDAILARKKQYYEANKADILKKHKADREATPEVYREQEKAKYLANSERIKERTKRYYLIHREQDIKRRVQWSKDNPEREKAKHTDWRTKNREHVNELSRARAKAHPEERSEFARQRRARQLGAEGHHTAAEMESLFKQQMELCANPICRVRMIKAHGLPNSRHADHIYPLKPRDPGIPQGTNYIENMQWLCRSCNCQKHAMDPISWALERGILLPNHPRMKSGRPKTTKTKNRMTV